jgi:hypothetical protein
LKQVYPFHLLAVKHVLHRKSETHCLYPPLMPRDHQLPAQLLKPDKTPGMIRWVPVRHAFLAYLGSFVELLHGGVTKMNDFHVFL